jgi:hypothetical protein
MRGRPSPLWESARTRPPARRLPPGVRSQEMEDLSHLLAVGPQYAEASQTMPPVRGASSSRMKRSRSASPPHATRYGAARWNAGGVPRCRNCGPWGGCRSVPGKCSPKGAGIWPAAHPLRSESISAKGNTPVRSLKPARQIASDAPPSLCPERFGKPFARLRKRPSRRTMRQ